VLGGIFGASGAKEAGAGMAVVGMILLIVGIPIYFVRGVWRILFG
jgi:hypothetical protein